MVPRVNLVLEYKGGGFFVEKFNYALQEQGRTKEQEKFISRIMVVKIGSSTITGGTENLDVNFVGDIARQARTLRSDGVQLVIVTSGAVASGKKELASTESSIFGQTNLVWTWINALIANGIKLEDIGYLLLTDNHLGDDLGVILKKTLRYGVLIINGEDAVNGITKSIICKDNDKLAGFLGKLIDADTLLLLTDKDGVLDKDGKTIETFDSKTEVVIFDESKKISNGGIGSKIQVAQEFMGRAIIANGRADDVVLKVARGEKVGTQFH
ncbi:MAG: hypothetical protein Q8P10_03235 [bacterium]|nr:hypothetical protein [bacterium]